MKKLINILSLLLLMLVLILSCSSDTDGVGSLNINVENTAFRTIRPDSSNIKITSYRIVGSYKGSSVVDKTFNGTSITLDGLRAGEWKFFVAGLNEKSEEIARSETKTVTIKQSQNISVSFELEYFTDGKETIDLTIKIPSADTTVSKAVAVLTPINNAELSENSLTINRSEANVSDGSFHFRFHTNVATGKYRIKFTMYDSSNSQVGYALNEVLHVYRDQTCSFEWYWDKDYIPPVAEVVFTKESGTYLDGTKLELSTTEKDATIYYTIDGSVPDASSNMYTAAITLDKSMLIRAIAIKAGLVDSVITEERYTVKVNAPVISLKSGTFKEDQATTISSSTVDSKIYYTLDGSTPTLTSNLYNAELPLTRNTNLRVIAVKDGLESSEIVSEDYSFVCTAPAFNYESGEYNNDLKVRLSTLTAGASVYYTINNEEPITSSSKYDESNPITVGKSMTVKACTYKEGWNKSDVVERSYTFKCSNPVFSVESGSYTGPILLTLSSQTDGAIVYYTLDGSTPSSSSFKYENAARPITKDAFIKAIAIKEGYSDSECVSAYYYMSPQNSNFNILDPISTDFRMGKPQGWNSGMNILNSIENATLFVDTTSSVSNIQWFYDGYEKEDLRGRTSISVGADSSKDLSLELGGHVITLRVLIDHISYTENLYYNCVSLETPDNFVFWGDIELGGRGPGGGYLIYDVDADNDSGNADGLNSRTCGWKYLEVAPNDMRLIDGLPSISNQESSNSTFIFGYYLNEAGKLAYVFEDSMGAMKFNTGHDNTIKLVEAMKDSAYTTENCKTIATRYAAKLCYDMVSHEREGAIDDWFLPSVYEMKYIHNNLPENEQATFTHDRYWTSSEAIHEQTRAYCFEYTSGDFMEGFRSDSYGIRPLRRF